MVDLYQTNFFKRKADTQQCQNSNEDLNSKKERLEELRISVMRIAKSILEVRKLREEECNFLKASERGLAILEAQSKKTPTDQLFNDMDALKNQITQLKDRITRIDDVIKRQNAKELLREQRAEIIKLKSEITLTTPSIDSQIIPRF